MITTLNSQYHRITSQNVEEKTDAGSETRTFSQCDMNIVVTVRL